MRSPWTLSVRILAVGLLSLTVLTMGGCGGDDEEKSCSGRTLVPHLSPIAFEDMYPPADGIPDDLGTSERTPYEWVLRLQARGLDDVLSCESVTIDKICLVGSDEAVQQFLTYPEAPLTADPGDSNDAHLQLTYIRDTPSGSVDNVALVIQSNATNFPTLVVPVCARVIPDGQDKLIPECTSPVTPPAAGQRDDTLCQ